MLTLLVDEADLALLREIFVTGTGSELSDPALTVWATTARPLTPDAPAAEPVLEYGYRLDFDPAADGAAVMPDLLLELFSEEIPARMQRQAADDLRKLVTDALVEAGLLYEGAKAFATPRRLALTVHGLPARSPDQREEKKGPARRRAGEGGRGLPEGAGLASIDQAKVQKDPKGDFYVAVVEKPGRAGAGGHRRDRAEGRPLVPVAEVDALGRASAKPGSLTWVRPLHSILCVFGPETEETEVVDFEIDGIRSGNVTCGHRFMAPAPIAVRRFDDYVAKLEKAKVVLDADRRKEIILADARDRALAAGPRAGRGRRRCSRRSPGWSNGRWC